MEVIEIGKTQLIFVLDPGDMKKYAIDTSEGESKLKEGFSRLVYDMGVSDMFLSGVLVQIFDSKNGGCEMFVTKIPDKIDLGDDAALSREKYVYIFSGLDSLLSACKMLSDTDIRGGCAYADESAKKFYLVLDREYGYLTEFGGAKCKSGTVEYLYEHCTLMTSNAISALSSLA